MGKKVSGPIEIVETGLAGSHDSEGVLRSQTERLAKLVDLSHEPSIDNLPPPVNLQGLYDQTVMDAENRANHIVSTAEENAVQSEKNAQEQAEEIIRLAHQEADRIGNEIRQQAEQDAIGIRHEAYQVGYQGGFDDGSENGYEEGRDAGQRVGWEQGYKEGWSQGHQEYMDVIEQLKKIITQVADQRHDFIESAESDLVALAFDVAEKLVHHQISNDDVIYHTIKSMLDYTVDHEKVLIRVHPEELAKLEPHREEFLSQIKGVELLDIIEDVNIDQGGCLLETNLGTIDAQIDTQFAQAKQALNLA
ncbi:hypothetical protein CMK22_08140 [Candidatus Poribacteria bacterium]|nr:hypothetical protein [Candidatus Poribacteria bacterium]